MGSGKRVQEAESLWQQEWEERDFFGKIATLRAESPLIFLEKSGRKLPLPDFSRKIEGASSHRVQNCRIYCTFKQA